jgi:hypothetical protein
LVALLLASLTLAFVYQLASRRYGWRVLAYWLLILAGVIGAEVAAEAVSLNITRLGDLRVIPDLTGGLLVMAVLWLLGV